MLSNCFFQIEFLQIVSTFQINFGEFHRLSYIYKRISTAFTAFYEQNSGNHAFCSLDFYKHFSGFRPLYEQNSGIRAFILINHRLTCLSMNKLATFMIQYAHPAASGLYINMSATYIPSYTNFFNQLNKLTMETAINLSNRAWRVQ